MCSTQHKKMYALSLSLFRLQLLLVLRVLQHIFENDTEK